MRFAAAFLISLACLPGNSAWAAPEQVADDTATTLVAAQGQAGAAAPVPVPEPSEKALRYYRSGNVLWVVSELVGLAIPCLLLFTGLSA